MNLFSNSKKARGIEAERFASKWLQNQGLTLLERNFHGKRGELDLIMQHDDTLVFVEVKQRKNTQHGHPFEFINQQKQTRIRQTAEQFCLSRFQTTCVNIRFDGFAVIGDIRSTSKQVEWLKNIIM